MLKTIEIAKLKDEAITSIADAVESDSDIDTMNETIIRLSCSMIELLEEIDAYLMEHA